MISKLLINKIKNKMKKLRMLSICLLFTFAFCTKKENQIDNAPKFFGFKSIDEARSSLGKYADLFVAVDGSIYQSSMKTNNSTTEDWDLFARFNSNPLSSTRTDGGDFFLNSIKLIFDKDKQSYLIPGQSNISEKDLGLLLKDNFGGDNQAKLIRNGVEIFQTHFYVPSEIVATNLKNIDRYDGSMFIKISRKGLNLEWNSDSKNLNGIVAYLSWTGDRTDLPLNEQGTKGSMEAAAKFDDTGNATISSQFFEGLPKNALLRFL